MAETNTQTSTELSERDRPIVSIEISAKERTTFASILAMMNLDNVSKFASAVRQVGHHSTANNVTGTVASNSFVGCKVNPTPTSGSYNIVFALDFSDGISWILKIPANGHGQRFDDLASKSLVAEARTMLMIKNTTTIPVPMVYAFDASLDNELRVPFILMERIDGAPLYQGWFNEDGHPKAQVESFRARALQSLASAMVQLNHFMLDSGGSIVFDSDDRAIGVGGAKVVDANTMWYCRDDNPDDVDIFCEKGPFTNPKTALLFMLDRRLSQPTDSKYLKGIYVLLRMLIEWAYERKTHGPRFVLSHTDLNFQNILVTKDGTLRGLIDWDGVAAVPREVGAAQLPIWLMHDWIESQYDYNIEERKPRAEAGYDESSPDELSCYRAMYAQFVEQEVKCNTKESGYLTLHGTTPKEEADVTRRSLVMRNLEIATNSPMVASDIVHHMLASIVDLTEADWEDGESDCDSSSPTDSNIQTEESRCDVEEADAGRILDGSSSSSSSENNSRGDSDDGSIDSKTTETGILDQCLVTDDLAYHSDIDVVGAKASVNESSTSNEAEFREQGLKPSTKKTESPSPSWSRRMLQSGCNTAETILRRIAKIGYVDVLHDAVDEPTHFVADFDEIPAKDSKPVDAAKLEKNETDNALNKAEIEKQEIWERLAIEVDKCGVPIELIQKYEFKITSCIIATVADELKAEQKQDQEVETISDVLPAPQARSAAVRMSETSEACARSVKMAGDTVNENHITLNDENKFMTSRRAIEQRPFSNNSSSSSASGIELLPKEAAGGFQSLRQSGIPYLMRKSRRSSSSEADTDYRTPDSSVHSEKGREEEDKSSSRVTSLCDDTGDGEGQKGEGRLNDGGTHGISEAGQETNKVRHASYVEGLDDKIDPDMSPVPSRVYSLCSGECAEAVDMQKADTTSAIDESALEPESGVGDESEDGNNDSSVGGEDESTSNKDEDFTHQQDYFVDRGGFDTWTILNVLGSGDLDELRLLRLKEGFLKLLEQC